MQRIDMSRPSIVIICPPHSCSTVIAKAIALCGWNFAETNPLFDRRCEWESIVKANACFYSGQQDQCHMIMLDAVNSLPPMTVIKDPRFSVAGESTLPIVATRYCHLIWLQRDLQSTIASFVRRRQTKDNEPTAYGKTLNELLDECKQLPDDWCGPKHIVQAEHVIAATTRKSFLSALGIRKYGPFADESVDLAMSIIDRQLAGSTARRVHRSGWDQRGRFTSKH